MIAWLREWWWVLVVIGIGGLVFAAIKDGLALAAVVKNELERQEINRQNQLELLKGHCAVTDTDGRALIYTCDGGKHVIRY